MFYWDHTLLLPGLPNSMLSHHLLLLSDIPWKTLRETEVQERKKVMRALMLTYQASSLTQPQSSYDLRRKEIHNRTRRPMARVKWVNRHESPGGNYEKGETTSGMGKEEFDVIRKMFFEHS